jgi:hypothetical protein
VFVLLAGDSNLEIGMTMNQVISARRRHHLRMPENNAMTVIGSDVVGLEQDEEPLIVIVTKPQWEADIMERIDQVNG